MNIRDVSKAVVLARTLPVRNSLSIRQSHKFIVASVRVQIGLSGLLEIRQHNNTQSISRSETLLCTNIEQSAHLGHTVSSNTHGVRCKADEVRVSDSLFSSQSNINTLCLTVVIEQLQQVDSLDTSLIGIRTIRNIRELSVQGLTNHVVDSTHNKSVNLNSHSLIHSIVNHGNKAIQLSSRAKGILNLLFGERHRNFKSHTAIEELSRHLGLIEHVGVIRLTIGQLPRLVLSSSGHISLNLLKNRTELPSVHNHARNITSIRTVDKDNLTDVIHKGLNIVINVSVAKQFLTKVNNIV